ncbi:MAG: hypothetical protein ABSA66_19710 [Roseiarcus sp.]
MDSFQVILSQATTFSQSTATFCLRIDVAQSAPKAANDLQSRAADFGHDGSASPSRPASRQERSGTAIAPTDKLACRPSARGSWEQPALSLFKQIPVDEDQGGQYFAPYRYHYAKRFDPAPCRIRCEKLSTRTASSERRRKSRAA